MSRRIRNIVLFAALALACVSLLDSARAQTFAAPSSQPPLYPYATGSVNSGARAYPQAYPQAYPYVGPNPERARPRRAAEHRAPVKRERDVRKREVEVTPEMSDVARDRIERRRKVGPTNHALVEELKRRAGRGKHTVVNEPTRYVHEKPRVITRRHIVDVPVVIERRRYVDDPPQESRRDDDEELPQVVSPPPRKQPAKSDVRVIRAEAEIRITGDDQMTIKLFRKGSRSAHAE